METKEIKGKKLNAEETKKILRDEFNKRGVSISEDELNEKVMKLCQMDEEAMENMSGGWCSENWPCTPNFACIRDWYMF